MKEPIEPNSEDCCGSGCNPCIFDVYNQQVLLYKKYTQNIIKGCDLKFDKNGIRQLEFTSFVLSKSIEICLSHRLLFFKQSPLVVSNHVYWDPGDHFLVKYVSDSLTCSRAYTPLKLQDCNEIDKIEKEYDFAIIIKQYDSGVVSKYLYNLKPGQATLWRGPYGSYKIECKKYNRIILIAQGTGILPFFSIINEILQDENNISRVILYYCCKDTNNILLRDTLYEYRSYWNFSYKIFLSNTLLNSNYKYLEPVVKHKLDITAFADLLPFSQKDQILICGSSTFMDCYKNIVIDNGSDSEIIHLF